MKESCTMRGTDGRISVALIVGLLSGLGLSGVATAQNLPMRADYTAWLAKYTQAEYSDGDRRLARSDAAHRLHGVH